jgi:hypothetical protein
MLGGGCGGARTAALRCERPKAAVWGDRPDRPLRGAKRTIPCPYCAASSDCDRDGDVPRHRRPHGWRANGAAVVDALNTQNIPLYIERKYADAIVIAQKGLTPAERVPGKKVTIGFINIANLAVQYNALARRYPKPINFRVCRQHRIVKERLV